jgi:hypothetical protein
LYSSTPPTTDSTTSAKDNKGASTAYTAPHSVVLSLSVFSVFVRHGCIRLVLTVICVGLACGVLRCTARVAVLRCATRGLALRRAAWQCFVRYDAARSREQSCTRGIRKWDDSAPDYRYHSHVAMATTPVGPWTKPNLGLVEVNGSTANNVIASSDGSFIVSVFVDDAPGVPPAERIKAVQGNEVLVSVDGFKFVSKSPPVHVSLLGSTGCPLLQHRHCLPTTNSSTTHSAVIEPPPPNTHTHTRPRRWDGHTLPTLKATSCGTLSPLSTSLQVE